jgi:hypothetical protein
MALFNSKGRKLGARSHCLLPVSLLAGKLEEYRAIRVHVSSHVDFKTVWFGSEKDRTAAREWRAPILAESLSASNTYLNLHNQGRRELGRIF